MNLLNLFEDDNSKPGNNYAEELAHQIFKVAPELDATGAADEVLDYAFDLAVNDLGRKRAHSLFAYDEDFDSDLVSAYADLQRQEVNEGYYDLNQSNVPGMEPIDFSTKPSFKDIIERYTQLVYQGHAGETSPEEDQEYDAIEQYVAKRFGEKGSAHLQKAGEVSYWGRDDKPFGRDSRSSNLGRPNQPGGDFRTTKAGKMHGQDAKMMKAKVANRLGRHPAPNLPESLADEFMAMAKAKGMNPRLRGTPDQERARTDAMLKQRAADRAAQPAPAGPDAEERAKLEARLKELEATFDPNFEYSDDHSFWTAQNSISKQINAIKQRLAQGLKEFAPPGSDGGNDSGGFDEATLKRLAAQWWNGDEDPRVEQLLMNTGWEIGQDEGYDNGGVFVVMSGDENGNTYLSWPSEELQGVSEDLSRRGFLRGLGAAALAGAGGSAAAGGYTPGKPNDWKYNMGVKRPGSDEPAADSAAAPMQSPAPASGSLNAQSSASRMAAERAQAAAAKIKYTNPKFKEEYDRIENTYNQIKSIVYNNKRQYSADPDLAKRQHAESVKTLIAADKEFAEKTNALINQYGRLKEQGVAEDQGRFAGDTPVNVGGAVVNKIQAGDTVKYFGEKARVIELNRANNVARISANGKTMNVRLSDLKQTGQGMAEGSEEWYNKDGDIDPNGAYDAGGHYHMERDMAESRMSELDAEYQDYKKLSPREFYNMYRMTKQEWLSKYKRALPQQSVAEADKKKENEPEVKDVALQRAISRAKADFPAAGSGIEALAKDFMRSQDQDSKSFDQLRQAERKQDQMLGQISKIDQEQEQEIQNLEDQNSTLASRLKQLQNVNNELEKKLAAMSGRRAEKKSTAKDAPAIAPAPISAPTKTAEPTVTTKKKTTKAEPTTSKAIGQIAKTLAPTPPSAAIDQMAQQLQPRQKELGFDEPVAIKPKKFDTSKASDAEYRDLTSRIARDIVSSPDAARVFKPDAVRGAAGQQEMPLENQDKPTKADRPEVDYDDPAWDAMVKRVGQMAKQGPRKTVWDPVKRVYKTVPVNK